MRPATVIQPRPVGEGEDVNESLTALPNVSTALAQDFARRSLQGAAKYGTTLRTHNGRNAAVDAYQELLDASVYLHQLWLETPEDDRAWAPYSMRDEVRQLRDEAISMAERVRRRLLP